MIAAKARHVWLMVRLNSKDRDAVYRVEARQLFEGQEEVGRLIWRFDPRARERRETPSRASLSPRIAAALRPRANPPGTPTAFTPDRLHRIARPPSRPGSACSAPDAGADPRIVRGVELELSDRVVLKGSTPRETQARRLRSPPPPAGWLQCRRPRPPSRPPAQRVVGVQALALAEAGLVVMAEKIGILLQGIAVNVQTSTSGRS